jgi:hypothetical protein
LVYQAVTTESDDELLEIMCKCKGKAATVRIMGEVYELGRCPGSIIRLQQQQGGETRKRTRA